MKPSLSMGHIIQVEQSSSLDQRHKQDSDKAGSRNTSSIVHALIVRARRESAYTARTSSSGRPPRARGYDLARRQCSWWQSTCGRHRAVHRAHALRCRAASAFILGFPPALPTSNTQPRSHAQLSRRALRVQIPALPLARARRIQAEGPHTARRIGQLPFPNGS